MDAAQKNARGLGAAMGVLPLCLSFDRLVGEVLTIALRKVATDKNTDAITRVKQLASSLLPKWKEEQPHLGELRYQLLTGVAGTLAFAKEVKAKRAVFIVHEFQSSQTNDALHKRNDADLHLFLARLSDGKITDLETGQLCGPITVPGAPLFDSSIKRYIGKAVRHLRP